MLEVAKSFDNWVDGVENKEGRRSSVQDIDTLEMASPQEEENEADFEEEGIDDMQLDMEVEKVVSGNWDHSKKRGKLTCRRTACRKTGQN